MLLRDNAAFTLILTFWRLQKLRAATAFLYGCYGKLGLGIVLGGGGEVGVRKRRRREKMQEGRAGMSVFPAVLEAGQEPYVQPWDHQYHVPVALSQNTWGLPSCQLHHLKIRNVTKTTSFCLNLQESIFHLMAGLCHSLGKKAWTTGSFLRWNSVPVVLY